MYTDAAPYQRCRGAAVAVVTSRDQSLTSFTIKTGSIQEAEEVAIALATTQTTAVTVITDGQAACRSYAAATVTPTALRLLRKSPPSCTVRIVWTLANSDLPGNDTVHALARALPNRAPEEEHCSLTPIANYRGITQCYRLGRKTFPPPNPVCLKCRKTH